MLRTSELDYQLPDSAVATSPASPRDSAKLMVIRRGSSHVEHLRFSDLPGLLNAGDLLVRNCTAVLPARFRGIRADTGGKVEGLYLSDEPGGNNSHRCRVLLKMRRHTPGAEIRLHNPAGEDSGLRMVLESRAGSPLGEADAVDAAIDSGWIVRIESDRDAKLAHDWLNRVGLTPLPPYILAARKKQAIDVAEAADRAAYQTVYASEPPAAAGRAEHGSVAAPTAGLHFTPAVLDRLAARGIASADVVLHVGLGTFKPVETEHVEEHPMHTEWCMVPPSAADHIARAKGAGKRVIAVGTTAARTLESFASIDTMRETNACSTRLLITPGYSWKHVDALLTNFHLPRSTLMAMVSAMLPGGATQLRDLYAQALSHGYRFYSFGDAMVVL